MVALGEVLRRVDTVATPANAALLAASVTLLLSEDGANVSGAILASGGGLVDAVARGTHQRK